MDHSPPGSFVHGISQARILEWVAVSFSRGIFLTQESNCVFCLAGRVFWPLRHLQSPRDILDSYEKKFTIYSKVKETAYAERSHKTDLFLEI